MTLWSPSNDCIQLPARESFRRQYEMSLDIIEQAARTAERHVCKLRALFCLLVAARFIGLLVVQDDPNETGRAAQMLPATLSAIAFSFWMLRRLERPSPIERLLALSVTVDACVCAIVIASNVIFPFPGYRSVLLLPETATFLALIVTAGYRVYAHLALLGVLLNTALLGGLVALDFALNEPDASIADVAWLYAVLLLVAGAIVVASARRTLRLVHRAKAQAHRLQRAEREMSVMLMDHHDASSLLSAVRFDLDELRAATEAPQVIDRLADDLDAVDETIGKLRQRAHAEALALCPLESVDTSTLSEVREQLERVVAPMRVSWHDLPAASFELTGGARAIRRVLLNLLSNAKQGNGERGAQHAQVVVHADAEVVQIEVSDDGPGFQRALKRDGTGTGLALVESVVEASGGRLILGGDEQGARVTIRLPRTSPRTSGMRGEIEHAI